MMPSTKELADAREMMCELLDQLPLKTYLFEIELKDSSQWQVRLDYRAGEQWQSVTLEVGHEQLTASTMPGRVRQELLAAWRKQLRACA